MNPVLTPQEELALATPNAAQFFHVEGTGTTICALEMDNGFVVTGESHCITMAAYDKEDGESYALWDAQKKVMELLAFRKHEAMAKGGAQ